MNSTTLTRVACFAVAIALSWGIAIAVQAQGPANLKNERNDKQPTADVISMEAEREKIWNSPDMLRARAWLQDYCSKSARVTPEQGMKYMQELANMTPPQMELWLLKFDHEEEQRQQRYSLWQQAHAAGISRALAANRATQQSYSAINQEQTEAADVAEEQHVEQTEAAQTMTQDKQLDLSAPYSYLGDGVHYHFHLYPYPY